LSKIVDTGARVFPIIVLSATRYLQRIDYVRDTRVGVRLQF
jgi:hypothetical protein